MEYKEKEMDLLKDCTLCPRNCHVNRYTSHGFCGAGNETVLARAALHFWEEPCISGTKGSGTVFFGGCNLKCVFCQNHEIAIGNTGKAVSIERLSEIFLSLQKQGANNINLVTPTPYIPQIATALKISKERGLTIPIVYNTGGYESVSSLKLLDGLIDIYMPDMKYYDATLAREYSKAEDYFDVCCNALKEMVRQVGAPVFEEKEEQFLMKRGVIVRHLLLPGETRNAKKILRYLKETYHDLIYISIMSQYTPLPHVAHIEALSRKVSSEEYRRVLDFCEKLNLSNVYIQEGECAKESFIPPFDETGL